MISLMPIHFASTIIRFPVLSGFSYIDVFFLFINLGNNFQC